MSMWQFLAPAFLFSVLLIVTHTYFGLHVLARGIVFIDLALAQFAALGVSLVFLAGGDTHGELALLSSFAVALAAALGFSLLRRVPSKTTREVVIGIAYVGATALSVLVLSRSVHGMEELKAIFNGNILWVSWPEVGMVATFYAVLVVLHFVFRHRFLVLSFASGREAEPSLAWEFAFFASFAAVIALAVNVAGVLLVFAFLIMPAFAASLLVSSFGVRLAVGWAAGAVGSVLGLGLAYEADLPVGATVVSILTLLPVTAALLGVICRRLAA